MLPAPKKQKLDHAIKDVTLLNGSDFAHHQDGIVDHEFAFQKNLSSNMAAPPYRSTYSDEIIYNSDIFQMQVNELLKGAQPRFESRLAKAESVLRGLKSAIECFSAPEPMLLDQAEYFLRKVYSVEVPFSNPRPPKDARYMFMYAKPTNINVIGSVAIRTAIKHDGPTVIDMSATMPAAIFQEKDYLDFRYFHKRAYYLACVACAIQARPELNVKIRYSYHSDNALQPVITVSSIGNDDFAASKCEIKILLAAPDNAFASAKLVPWRTCVRSHPTGSAASELDPSSTPLYNGTLMSECTIGSYLKFLHCITLQSQAFKKACVLLRIWLRQRGLGSSIVDGGFGGFEASTIVAWLLKSGGPNEKSAFPTGYSSFQLFKATIQFLASRDLARFPMLIDANPSVNSNVFRSDTPVFWDGSRGHNLLFKMTSWSYKKLRYEANITNACLANSTLDKFNSCFIAKIDDPLLRFDHIIRLKIPESSRPSKGIDVRNHELEFSTRLYSTLTTGLGNRVCLIEPKLQPFDAWSVNVGAPPPRAMSLVTLGLIVNPEHVDRLVDHGPSAEDKKSAAAFREFWGEKAELRRFKDGSILECLVWNQHNSDGSVLHQIITYVIGKFYGRETATSLEFLDQNFFQDIPRQTSQLTTTYQRLWDTFEALQKQIRDLDGLPLHVRQISPACPELRNASDLPADDGLTSYMHSQPMDIVMQFEGSTRWPDNIAAVQRTKIAFLIKLGELLEKAQPGYQARLGLENELQPLFNVAFLDIIADLAIFRLRIHHDREIALLDREVKSLSASPRSRESAVLALAAHKRLYIQVPAHTQAIRRLCIKHTLLPPTIRLLRDWCSSHLLFPHLASEFVELLATHVFTTSYSFAPPGSLRTAFLRIISIIAKWDWRSEPMLVNVGEDMSSTEVEAMTLRFEAWRRLDPSMNRVVHFVGSSLDPGGIAWTEGKPQKVVAARLEALAKAACEVIKSHGLCLQAKALFTPSLSNYDFIIRLRSKADNDAPCKLKNAGFKNLTVRSKPDEDQSGLDAPQLYMEELEAIYSHNCLFFHDGRKKKAIAGLWNPSSGIRAWKVNLTYSTEPLDEEKNLEGQDRRVDANKMAILNDIVRLGGSIISSVETPRWT